MRVAILGNSGSGKSTLARRLGEPVGAAILDLDRIAWEAGQIAVPRDPDTGAREVDAFCGAHAHWVVEGCYAGLIGVALRHWPHLIFLNPGESACIANCRQRPWEPHKYASKDAQDARLEQLIPWVQDYYQRGGDMSLQAHLACYRQYAGSKEELTECAGSGPPQRSDAR